MDMLAIKFLSLISFYNLTWFMFNNKTIKRCGVFIQNTKTTSINKYHNHQYLLQKPNRLHSIVIYH